MQVLFSDQFGVFDPAGNSFGYFPLTDNSLCYVSFGLSNFHYLDYAVRVFEFCVCHKQIILYTVHYI